MDGVSAGAGTGRRLGAVVRPPQPRSAGLSPPPRGRTAPVPVAPAQAPEPRRWWWSLAVVEVNVVRLAAEGAQRVPDTLDGVVRDRGRDVVVDPLQEARDALLQLRRQEALPDSRDSLVDRRVLRD